MPNWLNDAVFYEIYPQSFYDYAKLAQRRGVL